MRSVESRLGEKSSSRAKQEVLNLAWARIALEVLHSIGLCEKIDRQSTEGYGRFFSHISAYRAMFYFSPNLKAMKANKAI